MANKKELKTYRISGYVQVEVFAEIQATSLRGAQQIITREGNKYGKGDGTLFDYEEGNWCSDVEIERVEEVGADGKTESERKA